jgi:hypothetical protein
MSQEMVIFVKVYDLLRWLLPKSEQFPKPYRSTVTQRLMDSALDLQEALSAAQSQRGQSRSTALHNADACLARLRVYLRLIHQWQWINHGQYQHVSEMEAEIGRLLGGWMRQEQTKPSQK